MNSSKSIDNLPARAVSSEQEIHLENQKSFFSIYLGRKWLDFKKLASTILSPLFSLVQFISDAVRSIFSKSSQTEINSGANPVKPIKLIGHSQNQPATQNPTLKIPMTASYDNLDISFLEYAHVSSSSDGLSGDYSPSSGLSRSGSNESLDKTPGSDSDHDFELPDLKELSRPPSTDRYVEIPGTGNCFYIAFAIAARRLYPENKEVQRLLDWDASIDAILDPLFNNSNFISLTDDPSINFLKKPAANLRNLATVYIEQILRNLEHDKLALRQLETCDNNLEHEQLEDCDRTRQIQLASSIVRKLKAAILSYNENISNVKIPYEKRILEKNLKKHRKVSTEFLQAVEITQITEKKREMASLQSIIDNLTQKIINWNNKKIVCEDGGFRPGEMAALREYLNLMKEDAYYSGYPEIEALSTLFHIPVTVNDRANNTTLPFNHHIFPDQPTITLDYDGQHYNLILS
ncbi:MAG: OTU domain-containing protein [Chlamydiales bacterium]